MCIFTVAMLFAVVQTTKIMNKCMVTFADEIQLKTDELDKEKQTAEDLLYKMIPKTVVSHLKKRNGHVFAETFESVTIFFSDVVGFTAIAAASSPMQVRLSIFNSKALLWDKLPDSPFPIPMPFHRVPFPLPCCHIQCTECPFSKLYKVVLYEIKTDCKNSLCIIFVFKC